MTIRIEFGDILLAFNKKSLQLFARGRLGKFWPKHLTFHLEPTAGRGGAAYTPHVTDPRALGHRRRLFLERIPVASFKRVMDAIGEDMRKAWAARTRHVELQALRETGWIVSIITPDSVESWAKAFEVSRGRYRFRPAVLPQLVLDQMVERGIDPAELEVSPPDARATVVAMRVDEVEDDRLDGAFLWHFPAGLNGPPGWYMTPTDWTGPNHEVIDEIMARHVPHTFWNGMRTVALKLGLPFGEERLDAMFAKYRRTT